MSVDFYECRNCGETYTTCGPHFSCGTCETMFCSAKCGRKVPAPEGDQRAAYDLDGSTCLFCRVEAVSDQDLIGFLLKRTGLTRDDVLKILQQEAGVMVAGNAG